jgi:hypothetical protein
LALVPYPMLGMRPWPLNLRRMALSIPAGARTGSNRRLGRERGGKTPHEQEHLLPIPARLPQVQYAQVPSPSPSPAPQPKDGRGRTFRPAPAGLQAVEAVTLVAGEPLCPLVHIAQLLHGLHHFAPTRPSQSLK